MRGNILLVTGNAVLGIALALTATQARAQGACEAWNTEAFFTVADAGEWLDAAPHGVRTRKRGRVDGVDRGGS